MQPCLLNDYSRYDKLWGPSQRVVTLFFFCLFVCYHSRAVYVESALRLEMLDPSLSSEADRRPVEVGATEFLKCLKI